MNTDAAMAYRTTANVSAGGRRALAHPAFWTSLAVLLLNDHWLKGAHLLPGWLTGKLSDLAGLVVAPVLSAALVGGSGRGRRWLALCVPVVPFVAVKLSPFAARALGEALGWRIWPDPTDLLALAVLPLAGWLVRPDAAAPRRVLRERAGVLLGAVACLATSAPSSSEWNTDAWVADRAGPLDLRVRWVQGALDCDRVEPVFVDVLGRDAFDEGITFSLQAGDTLPLDRSAAQGAAGFDRVIPQGPEDCDAVMLQAEGLESTIVFWRRFDPRAVETTLAGETPGRGAVVLDPVLVDDQPRVGLTVRDPLEASPLLESLEIDECEGAADASTFSWSESAQGEGEVEIRSLERGPDGCFALRLTDAEELPSFFFVCVPPDAFPFEAGDTVDLQHLTSDRQRSLRLEKPGVSLVVFDGFSAIESDGIRGEMVDTEFGGARHDCGTFTIPGAFRFTGADGEARTIASGRSAEVDLDDGARATVMVGRVERTVTAGSECPVGEDRIGILGDVLILTEEDAR